MTAVSFSLWDKTTCHTRPLIYVIQRMRHHIVFCTPLVLFNWVYFKRNIRYANYVKLRIVEAIYHSHYSRPTSKALSAWTLNHPDSYVQLHGIGKNPDNLIIDIKAGTSKNV